MKEVEEIKIILDAGDNGYEIEAREGVKGVILIVEPSGRDIDREMELIFLT